MATAGHVYVMRVGDGMVKVGYSVQPWVRSSQLGLDPCFTSPWDEFAMRVERLAHRMLRRYRVHAGAELFHTTPSVAICAIKVAAVMCSRVPRNPRSNRMGQPPKLSPDQIEKCREWRSSMMTLSAISARAKSEFGVTICRQAIQNHTKGLGRTKGLVKSEYKISVSHGAMQNYLKPKPPKKKKPPG